MARDNTLFNMFLVGETSIFLIILINNIDTQFKVQLSINLCFVRVLGVICSLKIFLITDKTAIKQ